MHSNLIRFIKTCRAQKTPRIIALATVMCIAITAVGGTVTASAAQKEEERRESGGDVSLLLPTAGIEYFLSAEHVTLKNVEDRERTRRRAEAEKAAAEQAASLTGTQITAALPAETAKQNAVQQDAAVQPGAEQIYPAYQASPEEDEGSMPVPDVLTGLSAAEAIAAISGPEKIIIEPIIPVSGPAETTHTIVRADAEAAGDKTPDAQYADFLIEDPQPVERIVIASVTVEGDGANDPYTPAEAALPQDGDAAGLPADAAVPDAVAAAPEADAAGSSLDTVPAALDAQDTDETGAEGEEPEGQDDVPEDNGAAEGTDGQESGSSGGEGVLAEIADDEIVVAIASDFVNVREAPSLDAPVVGKLHANGVGKILERNNGSGWVKVQSGSVIGYISAEFLACGTYAKELASEVVSRKARVNAETLRVRAAADPDSDVITLIPEGEEFEILAEQEGWLKVDTPDGIGYISSDFADVEEFLPEAESKEDEEARLEEEARKSREQKLADEERKKAADANKKAEAARKAAEEAALAAESDPENEAAAQEAAAQQAALDAALAEAESAEKTAREAQDAANRAEANGTATPQAAYGGSAQGQAVANFALQFLGNPYVWGGSSLTNGADCSGFVMAVYQHFGVSLPHYDASQRKCGMDVGGIGNAQAGDIVCYNGHVGIYIGNGQIVHASNPREGIKIGTATYRQILSVRRIFN